MGIITMYNQHDFESTVKPHKQGDSVPGTEYLQTISNSQILVLSFFSIEKI